MHCIRINVLLIGLAVWICIGIPFTSARIIVRNRRQNYVRGQTTFWGQNRAMAPVYKWNPNQPVTFDTQVDANRRFGGSKVLTDDDDEGDNEEFTTEQVTSEPTSTTTLKPYVVKPGDELTLGESAFIAGFQDNKHAERPTAPPPKKEKKIKLSPRAVAALQRLPDERLAKLVKSQSKGNVILTPDKVKLFKEMDPDVLSDIINTGADIDILLDEEEEVPLDIPDPLFPPPVGTAEWYQQQTVYTGGFHPAYPVYSPELFQAQSGTQSSTHGTTKSTINVSDAKLKLLQKLKLTSIVKLVKQEVDLDITMEEAEIIKTSTIPELRELIDSGEIGSQSEPEIHIDPNAASTNTQLGRPVSQPQPRAPLKVSDSRLRILQRLKPESIVKTVRKQAATDITLEEAEWIKTATIKELRAAMDDGSIGTPIVDNDPAPSTGQSSQTGSNLPIGGFQPQQPVFPAKGGFYGPQVRPTFSAEQLTELSRYGTFPGTKRKRRATPKTKEERQKNFLNFWSRLPPTTQGAAQQGCAAYPGLGRIFFDEGPVDFNARADINAPQIIHRFREGTLRGNFGDTFPAGALAPYRVIPECATEPDAGCPNDLVNTAQISKMIDEDKPLILMNCEQQELAARLVKNGFVFKNNRPFFNRSG